MCRVDFVVTRVVEAPVERVWRAWSDPDDVKRWWGPDGFTAPVAKLDFREGGASLVCMRSPDGQEFYNTWAYTTIKQPERIEFVMHFADRTGARISPSEAGLPPGVPDGVHHVVTFTALDGGRTEVSVTESGYDSGPVMEHSKAGQEQVMDKFAAVVSGAA